MSTPMVITVSVLVVTAAMFVWGKIRSDIVALSALLVLVIINVISTEAALKGFSNPIVIMITKNYQTSISPNGTRWLSQKSVPEP